MLLLRKDAICEGSKDLGQDWPQRRHAGAHNSCVELSRRPIRNGDQVPGGILCIEHLVEPDGADDGDEADTAPCCQPLDSEEETRRPG